MPSIVIIPHGDGAIPRMKHYMERGLLRHVKSEITVTGLAGGMQSGKPSVAIFFELEDGTAVFLETSLQLLEAAAKALRAAHPDPDEKVPH